MEYTSSHLEAFKELLTIGMGRAANVLNQMIESHIELDIPVLMLISTDESKHDLDKMTKDYLATVKLDFKGDFAGTSVLIFPTEDASHLVSILAGEDISIPDLDAVRTGTLTEVGNIILNGVMGSFSNILNVHLDYNIPTYSEETNDTFLKAETNDEQQVVLLAQARFSVQKLKIEGRIFLIFEINSFEKLMKTIDSLIKELGD